MVRYMDGYANRIRGDRKKKALEEKEMSQTDYEGEIIDIFDYRPCKIPSPNGLECIKKKGRLIRCDVPIVRERGRASASPPPIPFV